MYILIKIDQKKLFELGDNSSSTTSSYAEFTKNEIQRYSISVYDNSNYAVSLFSIFCRICAVFDSLRREERMDLNLGT